MTGNPEHELIRNLVLSAKAAVLATRREDDPANLPSEVIADLEHAIYSVETNVLKAVVVFENCVCCDDSLEGPEQAERGWCDNCDLSD